MAAGSTISQGRRHNHARAPSAKTAATSEPTLMKRSSRLAPDCARSGA